MRTTKAVNNVTGVGARAPTPITVRLAPHCTDLPQLVERPALGRNRCCGSSFIEHDGPADPKMSAGAAVVVEDGPRVSGSRTQCLGKSVEIARPEQRKIRHLLRLDELLQQQTFFGLLRANGCRHATVPLNQGSPTPLHYPLP